MMAVMMLPGAVPAVIRIPGYRARLVFVAAYLVVWSVFGAAAAALQFMLESRHFLTSELALRSAAAANLSLLVIGAYQLTPLKRACLRLCRSEVVPLRYAFACLGASWQRPASASSSGEAPASFSRESSYATASSILLDRSLFFASFPFSLIFKRTSLVESAKRSASS